MQPGTNRVAFIIAQNSGIDSDVNSPRYQRPLLNYHYNAGKCEVFKEWSSGRSMNVALYFTSNLSQFLMSSENSKKTTFFFF